MQQSYLSDPYVVLEYASQSCVGLELVTPQHAALGGAKS